MRLRLAKTGRPSSEARLSELREVEAGIELPEVARAGARAGMGREVERLRELREEKMRAANSKRSPQTAGAAAPERAAPAGLSEAQAGTQRATTA